MTHPELSDRERAAKEALERIERWFGEFPPSGKFYRDGDAVFYGTALGSNGERDYMRGIARAALAAYTPPPEPIPQIPAWEELTQQQRLDVDAALRSYATADAQYPYEAIRIATSKPSS